MAASVLLLGGAAHATPINEALPEFDGITAPLGSPFPLAPVVVGTFSSIPAGESLILGSISGTFGNSQVSSSAGVDLFLGDGGATANDVLVGQCIKNDPCWQPGIDAWSHTFSAGDILALSSFTGPLVLTAVQTSETIIRLGQTTLVAETVPEPSTALLLAAGLLHIALRRRRAA